MLTKSPQDISKHIHPLMYTSAARVGFELVLKHLAFKKDEKLLIPAYIGINEKEGSGVFDPIQKLDLNYEFYGIRRDFSYDLEEINLLLQNGKVKALLVIHYFGFSHGDIVGLQKLCKKHGVVLIEDCAHAFDSYSQGKKLGDYGAFSFFSIHKNYPTKSGGMVKVNKTKTLISQPKEEEKIDLESISTYCSADHEAISRTKIKNYDRLMLGVKDLDYLTPLFENCDRDNVPLNLPVLVHGGRREELYFYLEKRGIPTVALYYRLIEQIDKTLFPDSYFLSNNILNLPINQDTNEEDIEMMISTLNSFK